MKLYLEAPWPPSNNTYYRRGRFATYISERGIEYKKAFCDYVSDNQFPSFGDKPVRLSIVLRVPDKRTRDIDNVCKAIFDAIESSGLVENDSQIESLYIEKGDILKGGRVILIMEEKC